MAASGDCGKCHDIAPLSYSGVIPSSYGNHDKHVDSTVYNYTCQTCHNNEVTGNEATAAFTDITLHADFNVDVNFDTFGDQGPRTSASYDTLSNNECASTYCHGDFAASDNTTWYEGNTGNEPVWTDTNPAACGTCHGETTGNNAGLGIPNSSTDWQASGESHVKHAGVNASSGYQYPCGFCHEGVYDATLTVGDGLGSVYETGLPKTTPSYTQHADGVRTPLDFYTNFTNAGTYTVGGLQAGTCSTTYCHSDGWDENRTVPDHADEGGISTYIWGGISKSNIQCNSCHNGYSNPYSRTNSWAPHHNGSDYDHYKPEGTNEHWTNCKHCHDYTTDGTDSNNPTGDTMNFINNRHVNRWKNVRFNTSMTNDVSSTTSYGPSDGSCQVYCHSSGGADESHDGSSSYEWYNGGVTGNTKAEN